MSRKRVVTITETYCYHLSVDTKSDNEAIKMVSDYYASCDDGYVGVAIANTHEKTTFKINKDTQIANWCKNLCECSACREPFILLDVTPHNRDIYCPNCGRRLEESK